MKEKASPFQRIMRRGQQKVRVTKETRELLGALSSKDHKAIACVIAKWLNEDSQK